MKKGQRTEHEKTYFNTGLGGYNRDSGSILRDFLSTSTVHQKAKNLSRNKKKRK